MSMVSRLARSMRSGEGPAVVSGGVRRMCGQGGSRTTLWYASIRERNEWCGLRGGGAEGGGDVLPLGSPSEALRQV
jgi:hypothetical protein